MGNKGSSSKTTTINEKRVDDINATVKEGHDIDNSKGTHNIDTGNVGKNSNIFLQNLQESKPALQ